MTWTQPAYEAIARFVAARTGLQFPDYRCDHAELAMRRAMERSRSRSPAHYLDILASDAAALDELVGELTVGETYFFREPAQFDFLRREALPDLRQQRPPGHIYRVWSAGCATGEEAYSLAILFEQEGLGDQVHVLGTDISRPALARAHEAVYKQWSLRGLDASQADLYLLRQGEHHAVAEKIRRRVAWQYLNLAQDVYPSFIGDTWGMDLILCRNVLIYLDARTVERVAACLFQSLAPGGWLLTASSDPPLQDKAPLATVVRDAGVFYRRPPQSPATEEQEAFSASAADAKRSFADGVPKQSLGTRETSGDEGKESDVAGRIRKLARTNIAEAERVCASAVERRPLNAELRYLHAVLLMDLGQDDEAVRAVRRAIYLDRSLAAAHFILGTLLWRRGDRRGASAAYRNAAALCAARPAEEAVPLTDGECAGRLARAAAFQLALLEAGEEAMP